MRYAVGRDRKAHKFTIVDASKNMRDLDNIASDAGVMDVMAAAGKLPELPLRLVYQVRMVS